MQRLEEKFSKDIDVTRVIDEKLRNLQSMIYKTNIGFKTVDTAINTAKVIYEPTLDNAKKVVIDTAYLYGMYNGFNGYSLAINTAELL